MYGLMAMEGTLMIVQLMAILKVYTQYQLELLVWMAVLVHLMKSALQNLLQHM